MARELAYFRVDRRFRNILCVLMGLALVAGPSSVKAAGCTNEAIREAQSSATLPLGTTYLPNCMALEMVSPPMKRQQVAKEPTFSDDGERVQFGSAAAIGNTQGLQSVFDSYVATRGSSGWSTMATSPPSGAKIATGLKSKGGPYSFTPDLSRWLVLGSTQVQAAAGIGQIFSGGLTSPFEPLSPVLVPTDNSGNPKIVFDTVEADSYGSAADLSVTVFRPRLPSTSYISGDPASLREEVTGVDQLSYVASRNSAGVPVVELLTRDRDGHVYGARCGSHLGGGVAGQFSSGRITQGAISLNGNRIYFSTRPAQPEGVECEMAKWPLRIFRRVATSTGPAITELLPGEPTAPGNDLYQGASIDGTKVFLTSSRNLTSSDQDLAAEECSDELGKSIGCDLYLYDSSATPSEQLTDISVGEAGTPDPGVGANVLSSITSISGDGSHAYFVAQGVLTTDSNPEGANAIAGKPNLYLYERNVTHPTGTTTFIGTLADGDKAGLWGVEQSYVADAYAVPLVGQDEGLGGDGHILVFSSEAPLTGENDGGKSDVFRYNADTEALERISKAAEGGSETPASDVSVGTAKITPNGNFAEKGRWVSEDGETIAFSTAESLAPGDGDGGINPYIWNSGRLAKLPTEASKLDRENNPTVSLSGNEVGFWTINSLLPQDGDTAGDVYVVRVEGGFPNPVAPEVCDPLLVGFCQGPPIGPLSDQGAASAKFFGSGNPKPKLHCKKGFVKKKGNCVKKKHKQRKKRANNKSGGGK